MKYRTDPEDPIVELPDDFDENPISEESQNDYDDFFGDGFDNEDDFRGK